MYFLNDEWMQTGVMFADGLFSGTNSNILLQLTGKYRMIGSFINNVFFYYFPGNSMPFILFGYIVHSINIILAYVIVSKVTKSKFIALICALSIAVSTSGQQTLSWLGAVVQTTLSVTMAYIAVLLRLRSMEQRRIPYDFLSLLFGYLSFLTKNSSVFVIPLIVFLPNIIKREKIDLFRFAKKYIVFFVIFVIFIFWNINTIFQFKSFTEIISSTEFIIRILFNSIWYPFISMFHMVISPRTLFSVSETFGMFLYQFLGTAVNKDIIVVTIMTDMISVFCSFFILATVLYIYWKMKHRRGVLLFGILWYVLSFIPMAVYLPERNSAFMESRYLYFSIFGFSLVFGVCIEYMYILLKKRFSMAITMILMASVLSFFYYKQIVFVQRDVYQNVLYSRDIKDVVDQMNHMVPVLPDKPVFYITGDRNFFYQNNFVPFQFGTGFMTMMAFRGRNLIPKIFFRELYLSKYLEEGYKEDSGQGYGYFWQKEALFDLFKKDNSLNVDQVVGLYYFGNERKLMNITDQIRNEIKIERFN
jgi:hypothetical protein